MSLFNILKKSKNSHPNRTSSIKNKIKLGFLALSAYFLASCSDIHDGVNSEGVEFSNFPKGWIPEGIYAQTDSAFFDMPSEKNIVAIERLLDPEIYSSERLSDGNLREVAQYRIFNKDDPNHAYYYSPTNGFLIVIMEPDTAYANAQLRKNGKSIKSNSRSTAQGDYRPPAFD